MGCIDKFRIVHGDGNLGVHGEGFDYIFSYQGGPESLVTDGCEWIYRAARPTFWRATTDNDRGSRFPWKSSMWLGADMFLNTKSHEVEEVEDGVRITYVYETTTVPSTEVDVSYFIDTEGSIHVKSTFHGKEGLAQLPVFGLRFIIPKVLKSFEYKGLSGETYPDRMAGGIEGSYFVTGVPVTPYLVPQECGCHMATEEVRLDAPSGQSLYVCMEGNEKFAFSALPYTAEELENAYHQEELPLPRKTVLCIYGAVRGVGGINSWGVDVEDAYHINAQQDISFAFQIRRSAL